LEGATYDEPPKGGLRIWKLEEDGSDSDRMYHHYLNSWMFTLNRLCMANGEIEWNELAIQLAKVVHEKFIVTGTGGSKRMV
jgi:hypothetical protein